MNDDDDIQHFCFHFTDFDGVECTISKSTDEGFTWPSILYDVVKVIEKQFGYDVASQITVKGVNMSLFENNPYAHIQSFKFNDDEQLNVFPETKAGLTD